MKDSYIRSVAVVEVIDGDTFRCDVQLGFYVTVRMSCRLAGINAPEHNQPGGPEAKAGLAELLAAGSVTVESVRADKFAGRFDAKVVVTGWGTTTDVRAELIRRGLAVPWDGTGPRPLVPWPPTPAAGRPGRPE